MSNVSKNRPVRKRLRLENFDYSQPGLYFITICLNGHQSLFGSVSESVMMLNDAGNMIGNSWNELPNHYHSIRLHEFVVMPNHFHGLIEIVGADHCVGPKKTVSRMVQSFKSYTTSCYIEGVRKSDWPPFHGTLWQRGFYDHIARDDDSLLKIKEYILSNPQRWHLDRNNHEASVEDEFDCWIDSIKDLPNAKGHKFVRE